MDVFSVSMFWKILYALFVDMTIDNPEIDAYASFCFAY